MRLLDAGFESGGIASPWTISGLAEFVQAPVHSGAWSMSLPALRGIPVGVGVSMASQVIPTTPGEVLVLAGWVYAGDGAQKLQLLVDATTGDGSHLLPIETMLPASPGDHSWWPHIWQAFTAESSQAYIRWFNEPTAHPGSTQWYLDDMQIVGDDDVAKRSRWLAHQRLIAVLKGINGAPGGFHTDLGSRVFQKYIRPVGGTTPPLPYICVPLVNTAPRVEHEGTFIRHTWTLPIMLFVAETNVGAYDSAGIASLYHLGEDVYRAVMLDPALSGTVRPVSFVSGGIEEGGVSPFDGLPYADAVIPIELSIDLALDVLGP